MQNVQNMQNSLLLTERTSALWAVYGYFQVGLERSWKQLGSDEQNVGVGDGWIDGWMDGVGDTP